MSPEDKEMLKARAREAGLSIQAYMERQVLGRHDAVPLPPGPTRKDKPQQELPLTG